MVGQTGSHLLDWQRVLGKGRCHQSSFSLPGAKERPIYARAAKDNFASLRVLEKCGFTITGYNKGYANARAAEIEEATLELK